MLIFKTKEIIMRYLCILFALFFLFVAPVKPQSVTEQDVENYSFINYKKNVIQYDNPAVLSKLVSKWNSGKRVAFSIAHFGDSHIQPDAFTSVVRKKLQDERGSGGRGMIFPYDIAKTYSQADYSSAFTGAWVTGNSIQTPPKLPVGISGFAAHTSDDDAVFCINFKKPLDEGPKRVTVYCNKDCDCKIILTSGNVSKEVALDTVTDAVTSCARFDCRELKDTLQFRIERTQPGAGEFRLYGIDIENRTPGVLYHNLGVGGANFSALKNQTYFANQIKLIHPDLVILDWGTNDIIYKNRIDEHLEETIVYTINAVRAECPDASILLTSVQDMNLKGKNITVAKDFSRLVKRIAFEHDCLFYDWYPIAGGPGSMKKWFAQDLGRKDNIHLTAKGYELKGTLFSNAFIDMVSHYKTHPEDKRTLTNEVYTVVREKDSRENQHGGGSKHAHGSGRTIYHVVKKGESVNSIAARYKTNVKAVMKLNHMRNSKLKQGTRLIVKP